MPTPRQRRKNRNPHRTVTKKTANKTHKKKLTPHSLPISKELLSSVWSDRMTPRENYKKMGLILNINGGTQKIEENLLVSTGKGSGEMSGGKREVGVVERDEDGNVVGYSIEEVEEEDEIEIEGEEQEEENELVHALETHAARGVSVKKPMYEGEIDFVQKCLKKYGGRAGACGNTVTGGTLETDVEALDYDAISKDLKLNILQLTKGEIKHKVTRYLNEQAQKNTNSVVAESSAGVLGCCEV